MSKYLHAQKLNRRARFERKSGAVDAWNQPVKDWELAFECWASVKTISGAGFVNQEFMAADREVSRATASVRIRKPVELPTADMRVVINDVIYEIRIVLPDLQDNRFVDIGVATGARDG